MNGQVAVDRRDRRTEMHSGDAVLALPGGGRGWCP